MILEAGTCSANTNEVIAAASLGSNTIASAAIRGVPSLCRERERVKTSTSGPRPDSAKRRQTFPSGTRRVDGVWCGESNKRVSRRIQWAGARNGPIGRARPFRGQSFNHS